MDLKRLYIRNFISVDHVELNLENQGLLLITGHSQDEGGANGVGKSTVGRNALCWVLFGETVNGVRGDKVINQHSGKDCQVELDFEIIDCNYKIIRTRAPNSLTILEEGKDISFKTEKENQLLIEKILGRSKELFLFSDVFGQGKKSTFLELTPGEQKSIIEEILPLNETNEWLASTIQFEAESGIEIRAKEDIINIHNGQLAGTRKALESLKNEAMKWETNRLRKLGELQVQLMRATDSNNLDSAHLNNLKTELAGINIQHVNLEQLENDTTRYKEYNTKKLILEQQLETLQNNSETCITCLRPISKRDQHQNIINLEIQLRTVVPLFENYKKTSESLYQNHLDNNVKILKQKQLKTEIEFLEKRQFNDKERIEKEIDNLNNDNSPFSDSLDSLIEREGELIAALLRVNNQLLEIKEEQKILTQWKKGYGKDIPLILFNMACPFIEERTNEYLRLLNNSQIKVKVDTIRELQSGDQKRDFSITVESATGGNNYSLLSGGEQQIVNFAVSLALSDLAETQYQGGSNFSILDEPFTNLDQRNTDSVLNFLTTHFLSKKKTVILISNEERLRQSIPNKVELCKKNGFTVMENNDG